MLGRDEFFGRLRGQQHVVDDLLFGEIARIHGIGDLFLDQRRPDIAGADTVTGDLEARKLERHGLGETCDAVLGGHIGRLEW